jgi:hypothetical protein
VIPAAESAANKAVKVRELTQEILANPLSHTQDALDKAEADQTKAWALVEFEMAKCTKPDNTKILFADFWVENIYGLSPAYALFCLYIPTIVSFVFVLFLQFGFIFYIQEVVRGQREDAVARWQAVVCYGSNIVPKWDSKNPAVLRIVCLLTFMTEVIRVRVESTVPFCFIAFVCFSRLTALFLL